MTRRDALNLAIAGAISPLLSLLPEREGFVGENVALRPRLVCGEYPSNADWQRPTYPHGDEAEYTFLVPAGAETARFVVAHDPYVLCDMSDGSQRKVWPLPVQKEAR